MRAEIKELHQRLKTTTIYVTHDQIEAMTMADKIVVMHDGIVEQIGAPLELYDQPANLFVAGFIGSPAMNICLARPRRRRRRGVASRAATALRCRSTRRGAATASRCVYGMRPEHCALGERGLPAEVVVVEPTGSETQVIARSAARRSSRVFRERHRCRAGREIRLAPEPARAHLFDAASGKRLVAQ